MNPYQAVLVRERNYARDIRLAATVSLVLVMAVFLLVKQPYVAPYAPRAGAIPIVLGRDIQIFETPKQTEPVRPKLPVADPNGVSVDPGVGQHNWNPLVDQPVAATEIPVVEFWAVQVKPRAVDLPMPVYPELARLAGIEGNVTTKALVDTSGMVIAVEVLKASGNSALDAAAVEAAKQCRFTPALQRDQKVRVWVAIPYSFRLH